MNKINFKKYFSRRDAEKLCSELNSQLDEELKKDIADIDTERVERIAALLKAVEESPFKEYDPHRVLDRVYRVIKE